MMKNVNRSDYLQKKQHSHTRKTKCQNLAQIESFPIIVPQGWLVFHRRVV